MGGVGSGSSEADRFTLISGCSGGGKSTLLTELARRGHATVPEPGRRILEEARARSDGRLRSDPAAFARRAVEVALADREAARALPGRVFFDRGLVDAAAALEHATGEPALRAHAAARYGSPVFLAPPWPAIYRTDADRRHGFEEAAAEYDRLLVAYALLGYAVVLLPELPVAERADWLLARLSPPASTPLPAPGTT